MNGIRVYSYKQNGLNRMLKSVREGLRWLPPWEKFEASRRNRGYTTEKKIAEGTDGKAAGD